jgi:hypothetical protein
MIASARSGKKSLLSVAFLHVKDDLAFLMIHSLQLPS